MSEWSRPAPGMITRTCYQCQQQFDVERHKAVMKCPACRAIMTIRVGDRVSLFDATERDLGEAVAKRLEELGVDFQMLRVKR